MKYYFTADLHLGHLNKRGTGIIDYCNRPFLSIESMDKHLIDNWNNVVNKGDTVIHVGDFCFKNQNMFDDYRSQLNGNIVFIKGNHDRNNVKIHHLVFTHKGRDYYVTHKPNEMNDNFDICLVGHIHEKWKFKKYDEFENYYPTYAINVGVDQWNYEPVSLEKILPEFYQWRNNLK